jgi:uncharacterized protein DUF4232
MPDFEQEVRALLERRANDVPPRVEVPATLVRRARTRFAAYAVGLAAAVVVVAGIGAAALRSAPGGPVTTPGSTSPSVGAPAACTADQLSAIPQVTGAMGSVEAAIEVGTSGDEACLLRGTPNVTVRSDGVDAPVQVSDSPPAWKANDEPQPAGWPDVIVDRSHGASFRIRWSNWCGGSQPTLVFELDDGTTLDLLGRVLPPPCNGPSQPSTIEVGPFEPAG